MWDNSLKHWLRERWSTFCDFDPKQHSKFRRDFGTNSKLSVWVLWLVLWGVFSVGWVGWFFVVFHRCDTTASLSKERTADPFSRQCLTHRRTGSLRAVQKDSGEKILLCVAQSYPWERRKLTQPAVVMTFIRIRARENHSCLSYRDSSKSGKGDSAEILCLLIITVIRNSNLLINKKIDPVPHVEFLLKSLIFFIFIKWLNVDLTKHSDRLSIMYPNFIFVIYITSNACACCLKCLRDSCPKRC